MSRRRRSGTSLLADAEEIVELQERQFAECTLHVRQNKEVISDNISRIRLVRKLQEQITQLQGELLSVRQQNRDLYRRMVQMHDETRRARGEAAIDALDSILAAVPALQHLRTLLASMPIPDMPAPVTVEPVLHSFVNPTATRPAATAAVHMGLDPLCEAADEPSPSPRRRRSPAKHSPSPRRLLQFTASSPSPSPKRSPQVRKKKRRESGLLLPVVPARADTPNSDSDDEYEDASPQPSPLPSPFKASCARKPSPEYVELDEDEETVEASITEGEECAAAEECKDQVEEVVESKEGKKLPPLPKETPQEGKEIPQEPKEVPQEPKQPKVSKPPPKAINLKVQDIAATYEKVAAAAGGAPSPVVSPTSPVTRIQPMTIKRVPVPPIMIAQDDDAENRGRSPALSPPLVSPLADETTETEMDTEAEQQQMPEEGRTRRARGSVVSYKEPSLRKKMRKPDGAAVDDVLGVRNRAEAAVTGVRRKSALPRSTARVALGDAEEKKGGDKGDMGTSSSSLSALSSSSASSSSSSLSDKADKAVRAPATTGSSLVSNVPAPAPAPKAERAERSRRISPANRAALADLEGNGRATASGIPAPIKVGAPGAAGGSGVGGTSAAATGGVGSGTTAERRRRSAAV